MTEPTTAEPTAATAITATAITATAIMTTAIMTETTEFTLELAQYLYDNNQIVDFDWAWQVLGYSRKDNAKRMLVSYFEPKFDYFVQLPSESPEALPHDIFLTSEGNSKAGRPTEKIYLTVECFKEMGMLSKSEQGKQIRKYFLKCEAIAKQSIKAIPQLQQQIQELQQNFAQLQSQVLALLPPSADFIPPGWDNETWQSLPPQDKRHFRHIWRRRNFQPSPEESKEVETILTEEVKQQQQAELKRVAGEVPFKEMWRIEDAKQEMLARFWAQEGQDEK